MFLPHFIGGVFGNLGGGGGDTNNKGWFATELALTTAYPIGEDGWYAIVGDTDTIWVWDGNTTAWVNTNKTDSVISVFSRTGAITSQNGDYTASQITNIASGGITSTTVQGAIDEVAEALPIPQLNANTRYVSPVGNNALSGEIKAKKQTISNATTSLDAQSSGIIYAEAGTYAEDLVYGTAQSRRAIIGDRDRVVLKSITFNQNCQQCKISNVKFENTTGGVAISVQSTLSGFVFDSLNCGGNHTNPIFLDVQAGGSGFITLSNCDLSNKVINLANTATPRFLFVNNCANFSINAGTGWVVVLDYNSQNIFELSSNNNIIKGITGNALLSNSTEYNAVVAQGALANGFYFVNYTQAGVFAKGDIILRQHPVTLVYNKHYNTPLSSYYITSGQQTIHKSAGEWKLTASINEYLEQIAALDPTGKVGYVLGINSSEEYELQLLDLQFDASEITYNNATSGLEAENVQDAIDELSDIYSNTLPYTQTFNATTDWGTASGGFYTITIPLATHGKAPSPTNIQVFELIGSDYKQRFPDIFVNSSGDVLIKELETPDSRFEGKISINF